MGDEDATLVVGSPADAFGSGEMLSMSPDPQERAESRPSRGRGRSSSGAVRGLLHDVPTDSLDLQQLVRTGERTKVWRACWRDTGDLVTVKAIDVESAELELDVQESLRREVDTLRRCRHPNVVSFQLSYVNEGRLWVVSEYHDAVSIRELLSAGLSERAIRYVCAAVLSGLVCIHAMGKTHRYVKGANILLDAEGVVRLGDFGVAEQLSTLTRNKATIGTPYWMAPEVVLRPRDAPTAIAYTESDVWSLGITAIEMAEVLPPHASTLTAVRVLKAIAEGPPPTFSFFQPSRQLRSFVAECLEKDLSRRPNATDCLLHEFLVSGGGDAEEEAARAELLTRREAAVLEQRAASGEDPAAAGPGGGALDVSLPVEAEGGAAGGAGGSPPPSPRPDMVQRAQTIQSTMEAPKWQPDAEARRCPGCARAFNPLTLRRHHCRGCGRVFCAGCSRFLLQLDANVAATLGVPQAEPQRTCESCFTRLSSIEFSRPYDVHGDDPIARHVLLIHDTGGSRQAHVAQLKLLLQKGYRVLTLDLPGHGSRWHEPLSRASAVAAVKEVVVSEGVGKVMLIGVGLGGYVALLFAVAHPEDCAALLLADVATAHSAAGRGPGVLTALTGGAYARALGYLRWGFGGVAGPRLAPSRLTAALAALHVGAEESLLARCFLRPGLFLDAAAGADSVLTPPAAASAAGGSDAAELGDDAAGVEEPSAEGCGLEWGTAGWLEIAAAVEKPVMLINSEHAPRGDEQAFVRALRAGQLSVIADCVHAYLESPEPYNEHLDRWLGTVYPLEEPG
eukprot:COSAG04_NODE_1163_length_8013_cov_106.484963_2_plen_791_part_00